MNKGHNCWYIALLVFNVVTLLAVYAINALSSIGKDSGIFISTQTEQSKKFYLDITPAGWTFSIWGVIYTWQTILLIYACVNLFRKNCHAQPLYASPYFLSPLMWGCYALANACNIAWCFFFDRSMLIAALVVLLLNSILLIVALALSYKALGQTQGDLREQGRGFEVWLVRVFVQNGLAIYGTWTSIAALLNLAMVLAYTGGDELSSTTASTAALGVLALELAVFALTDLCLLDRLSRYTLTPYLVVVVALVGSLSKNWRSHWPRNSVFAAALLGVAGSALVVKMVVTVVRHVKDRRTRSVDF